MSFQINAHNFNISSDLRLYIEEILQKVLKGLVAIDPQVEIMHNTHHRKGEIFDIIVHLPLPHKVIHARVNGVSDIRAGMRVIKEKLESQVEKYKNKSNN